jgi:UDP-2,3-diacylglucosamine pyrophosphatase LpxH
MLVTFSDIHFSDGTLDPFNVPPYAVRIVLDGLKAILERPGNQVEDVEVVLLGDIFDILRSDKWNSDNGPKPWSPLKPPLEERANDILEGLLRKNAEALSLLTGMRKSLEVEVTLRYLPGNHDRVLNKFPSTRERLVQALDLDHDSQLPFELCRTWPRYNLFAEHGDRLDSFNCEGPMSHSCIGDAFVIYAMNHFYLHARELLEEMCSEEEAWVLSAIQEVDHVRPKWATLVWLQDLLGRIENPRLREALQAAWSQAVGRFLALDLDQLGMSVDPRILGLIRQLSQAGPSLLEDPVVRGMLAESDHAYVRGALDQVGRHQGSVDHVVNGHTHHPCHIPLSRDGGRLQSYFNTGAWRHTINLVQTPDSKSRLLVPWEEMSFLVFYDPNESSGLPGRQYRYEMWQGMRS